MRATKDALQVGLPAEFDVRSQFTDGASFVTKDTTGNYNLSPIHVREANFVTNTQSAIEYSPTISFHWGDRVAKQLSLDSQGAFIIRNNSAIDGKLWHSGNSYTIIDGGSNTNGTYIKFSDGTQICHAVSATTAPNIAYGNIWRSDTSNWTFPASFASTPSVSYSVATALAYSWIGMGNDATCNNSAKYAVFSGTQKDNSAQVTMLAIGRWK